MDNEQPNVPEPSPKPDDSLGCARPPLLFQKEVYHIVSCAHEVLNTIGNGLHEKIYERALAVELRIRSIPYSQQPRYGVVYKGESVGEYVPDLTSHEAIVIDAKVIDAITKHELGKMLNYLRITKLPVGVILNFRYARLEWKRVILTSGTGN
jgi:GxxExxY protein